MIVLLRKQNKNNLSVTAPLADEILSVSIVNVYTGTVLLDTFVWPEHHDTWPEAEHINHISPAIVKGSPRISDIKNRIENILSWTTCVIGYNVKFDLSFLRACGIDYKGKTHDVMESYRKLKRLDRRCSLSDCASCYGYKWPDNSQHSSLGDVRATIFCYRKIEDEWRELKAKSRLKKAFDHLRDVTRYNYTCPFNSLNSIRTYLFSSDEVQMTGKERRIGVKEYIEKNHPDWISEQGVDALLDVIMDENYPKSF